MPFLVAAFLFDAVLDADHVAEQGRGEEQGDEGGDAYGVEHLSFTMSSTVLVMVTPMFSRFA